jgi:poly(3-hydroxybutyrate) depolymerase
MPARRKIAGLASAAVLALALGAARASAAERLGALPIDPHEVSVAGFSSGAFMANQIHIAHSAGVMGAALVAGGLYGAAVEDVTADGVRSSAALATLRCAKLPFVRDDVPAHKAMVEAFAAKGWIDPPSNLKRTKLYVFTGGLDAFVDPGTVEKARDLYVALGAPTGNITFVDHSGPAARAGHSWVTTSTGGACSANAPPFINACGYDQAGAELKAIYGPDLKPAAPTAAGRIVPFDQTEFVPEKAAHANGLSDTGFLYVPRTCEAGAPARCRLQVVLHGCTQSAETMGDTFYAKIGLNEWADANRIVVLYPQAHATTLSELPSGFAHFGPTAPNPMGCWNWWGYSGDTQYLTKRGVQVEAIWKMIQRLEGK